MTIASWFNTAWMWQCRSEALRYERAVDDVQGSQLDLLIGILQRNSESEYGRKYRFRGIRTARQFQDAVPLCSYPSLRPLIERIAAGETGVLTREPVLMLEPTSGSSGAEKLIPYTRSLKRQFQRAISAWAWDTLSNRPEIRRGSSYWSLSPAFGARRTTSCGLPIGFEDDTQYLSLPQRVASSFTLAVDPAVSRLENIDNFRYATLRQLLLASDLTLISVWSPTYLTTLVKALEVWWPEMVHDLLRGGITWPNPRDVSRGTVHASWQRQSAKRADELASIFRSSASLSEKVAAIWPTLRWISCWTDASAAHFVPELRNLFPDVEIQSKGLIATEAVISIPRIDPRGNSLAIRSHFIEFQEETASGDRDDSGGPVRLAHELELGRKYRVIVTTGGGLYRYQLGDRIQLTGFWNQCPLIQFLGRSMASSDLVGEKLNEQHVREVLQGVFGKESMSPSFALLVPVIESPPRYVLYVQDQGIPVTAALCQRLSQRLEDGLEQNPYYRHAVQLGQLDEAKTIFLDPHAGSAWDIFERHCIAEGQRLGDIKPVSLHPGTRWAEAFADAVANPAMEH